MHALFEAKVECKMTEKGRIIFFARFRFESGDRGHIGQRAAVTEHRGYRRRITEILAAAAYPPQRSSNANGLCKRHFGHNRRYFRGNCGGI
jgi:hypothetical protein